MFVYRSVTVLITLVIGVVNPVITGRGPTLQKNHLEDQIGQKLPPLKGDSNHLEPTEPIFRSFLEGPGSNNLGPTWEGSRTEDHHPRTDGYVDRAFFPHLSAMN